jgi:acetyltransferase-like isoleucine patch superfamily enzyme
VTLNSWKLLFKRAQESPHLVLPGALALLNGYWHKLKFVLLGKKVMIGKAFRVYGSFHIVGYGRVTIGDNCFVIANVIKPVTFSTGLPDAHIMVGNNVGFNGTTIQCYKQVQVNDWCNIADAYIVDSQAHLLSADRRFVPTEKVPTAAVKIMKNVWVSTNVVITQGVTIGKNSVIGACSLVRSDIPENSFYAGNPARFIKEIPPPADPEFDIEKM